MFLFIPVSSNELKLSIANSNIHIVKYNTVSFRGFNCIRKFLYEHNLSMPIPQNVLVAATYIAVCLHYETVELYGVEHSWTKIFLLMMKMRYVCIILISLISRKLVVNV